METLAASAADLRGRLAIVVDCVSTVCSSIDKSYASRAQSNRIP